jgi:hypothetical protein
LGTTRSAPSAARDEGDGLAFGRSGDDAAHVQRRLGQVMQLQDRAGTVSRQHTLVLEHLPQPGVDGLLSRPPVIGLFRWGRNHPRVQHRFRGAGGGLPHLRRQFLA